MLDETTRDMLRDRAALNKAWAEIERLRKERADVHGYLSRFFQSIAPECTPFDDTLLLATQIDNAYAGLLAELAAAQAEIERLRQAKNS